MVTFYGTDPARYIRGSEFHNSVYTLDAVRLIKLWYRDVAGLA